MSDFTQKRLLKNIKKNDYVHNLFNGVLHARCRHKMCTTGDITHVIGAAGDLSCLYDYEITFIIYKPWVSPTTNCLKKN